LSFAQAKKGAKGTIEIIESKDGKHRFTVRDADGKYLGGSTVGHPNEKETKEAVGELKRVLASASYVSKKAEAPKDKKSAAGEVTEGCAARSQCVPQGIANAAGVRCGAADP
jgi:hypothetical protein